MPADTLTIVTHSDVETEALGLALAPLLPDGAVLALRGELAAGKTCFVRGLAAGLGTEGPVSSPTFTIANEYSGRRALHHLDLYRLETTEDILGLGVEEYMQPAQGISAIEWADRAESLLPKTRVDIAFEHAGGDDRKVTLRNTGVLPTGWVKDIRPTRGGR